MAVKKIKAKQPTPQGETAKGKGRRFFIALIVFVVLAFASIPAFAGLGSGIADRSTSVVLPAESHVLYVYNVSGSGIPYGQSNTSVSYDMPVNETVSYVQTNLTMGELNDFSVDKLVLYLGYSGNLTEELGFGTNSSNFVPAVVVSTENVSQTNFTVAPQYLTGNQSQDLMFKFISNNTAYSFSFQVYGDNGLHTIFGPLTAEEIGYVFSGTVIFGLAAVAGVFYDLDFGRKKE